MRGNLACGLVGVLAMLAGCGHNYAFPLDRPVGALQPGAHPLAGRRIAFDFSRTPTEYRDRANGHSFHLTGIRAQVEQMFRRMFANEQIVESPPQADVVLSLELGFEMSAAFPGAKCECRARWEIRSPTGQPLATGTATEVDSQAFLSVARRSCEIAHLKATPAALDRAFLQLRSNPIARQASPPTAAPQAAATPPEAAPPAPAAAPSGAKVWYFGRGGEKLGPYSEAEMRAFFSGNQIAADTLVWRDGMPGWAHLCNAAELAGLVQWYYERTGSKAGPVTALQIRQLAQAGTVARTTLVWRSGMPQWLELQKVPELANLP